MKRLITTLNKEFLGQPRWLVLFLTVFVVSIQLKALSVPKKTPKEIKKEVVTYMSLKKGDLVCGGVEVQNIDIKNIYKVFYKNGFDAMKKNELFEYLLEKYNCSQAKKTQKVIVLESYKNRFLIKINNNEFYTER